MNDSGQSDRRVVPEKQANKGRGAPRSAEPVEERRLTKGNPGRGNSRRTQCRTNDLETALTRIRQVAERDHEVKFTSLWHHVHDINHLREAYFSLKRKAAAGVDGVTWYTYGETLEERLEDLAARLQRGAYRPHPVKRIYLLKPDGRKRPIGITATEDKIVQRAMVNVLNAIYEVDFLGFNYGYRPKRTAHMALDALAVGVRKRQVNWVLDADLRGFFDTIDHGWLVKFVEHRIADQRVLRHIKKWLRAGVLEDGEWRQETDGTPQGGSISPLLANIYLHYAFDLWVQSKRVGPGACGDIVVVRYADDIVMGFEHKSEAVQFLEELKARLAKFHLELHPTKTKLIEFGRHAKRNRAQRGAGKPETFDFLGFTHCCSETRKGWFQVLRQTNRKRKQAKLNDLKQELRARMHAAIPETGAWLRSVLKGHYQYYGVPGNRRPMDQFHNEILKRWRQVLRRRSQRGGEIWTRLRRYIRLYLPRPKIVHPWPEQRLRVNTCGRSPVR